MDTASKIRECEAILQNLNYVASTRPRVIEELSVILGCNESFKCEVGRRNTTVELLLIKGVIETVYHDKGFYTPVEVWIPRMFPIAPPLFYVVPQRGMILAKGHKAMEHSGKCLVDWRPQHSISFILSTLVMRFNESPPLYAVRQRELIVSSNTPLVTRLHDDLVKKCVSLKIMITSSRDQCASHLRSLRLDISQKQYKTVALKKKINPLREQKERLLYKIDSLEKWISENAHRASISPDDITPTSDTDSQIVELQADISASYDLLHLNDRRLAKGIIDGRQYVKIISSIGSSIFINQSLLNKIIQMRQGTEM